MPARAPHDPPPHLTVTLRLLEFTGIPDPCRRTPGTTPLRFVHAFTGSPADATPAPQNRKAPTNMNNTQHIGRLVKAPRFTISNGDKARANFTLAVDGYNDTTSYIPITCFGKLAENVAEYTDKGHLVAIEGRISSGKYTNDQGETVYTLDIIATNVKFLKAPRSATTTPETVDTDHDVPTEGEVA
jgi:single-strand DNA-binding protein